MQNSIQKFRQSSIVFVILGIYSEKLKTLRGSNYDRVEYFLLKFCTPFLLVLGQFPDGHFPEELFPGRQFPEDISPTDTFRRTVSLRTVPRTGNSTSGHFPDGQFPE